MSQRQDLWGSCLIGPLSLPLSIGSTVSGIYPGASTAAGIGGALPNPRVPNAKCVTIEAQMLAPTGGTTADAYVQTSYDGGTTWIDIMNFHFTNVAAKAIQTVNATVSAKTPVTPGDGALTANTAIDSLVGDRFRIKFVIVGVFTGGTLNINGFAKG